jgi:uncharacterized protein YneR
MVSPFVPLGFFVGEIDMKWRCFKDEFPKENSGILIIIRDYSGDYNVKDHIYYGFACEKPNYIDIVFDVTDVSGMSWKVLKDYDSKDLYWYYHNLLI